ncbi:hypothetical protein [Halorubrum sp. AS12]|uniref:hypothetical protein n=2 Tax=Halorubrum TaxID=56688 RepID=UPI003DA750D6
MSGWNMDNKFKIRMVEVLAGAAVVVPFLIDVYLYRLYTSNASSVFFTLILPILFAAVVIAGSLSEERSLINAIVGVAAVITFIVGSGSLYSYFSTEGGVFFGGLFTVVVSIGLFACVLLREIYHRVGGSQGSKVSSELENP